MIDELKQLSDTYPQRVWEEMDKLIREDARRAATFGRKFVCVRVCGADRISPWWRFWKREYDSPERLHTAVQVAKEIGFDPICSVEPYWHSEGCTGYEHCITVSW
jgi:hypothetical protein